jgi:hypothetical protein
MAEPKQTKKLAAVKGGLNFVQRMMRDADEPAGKLDEVLKAKQAPMTTPSGTGLPLMPRDQGMYTPREQKDLPRMPKVDAARAANKQPKYTERMQDLLDSPTARKKVDKLINQGKDLNMTEWYGTEPLRQVAMDAGRTPEQFESLMAQLASASQRNPVDKQNQMGSYLYHLSETGRLPENSLLLTNKLKKALKDDPSLAEGRTLVELPTGYGSLAQGDIFNRAVMIGQGKIGEALPPNKKLGTFYENLLGNLQPVTVDVNAVRGPIIERGDPRWLTSKLVEKDESGNVINSYKPREMFESGEMTMREAKQRPGFWEAAPSGSEYAGFEDLWQRGAKRHGVKPAEAQALGWYGSADVTALKTKPENYVDNLERLIKRTAEQTGQSPNKVMQDLVTGEGFLRKKGGSVDIKDADTKLAAAIQKRMSAGGLSGGGMAKGGKVDIKATDALLSQAIARRMAGGGGAFKKIAFMAKGGAAVGNESVQDTLKKNQSYSVLDQGSPKKYGLSGVVLAGDSWLAGDEKTNLAKQAFGQDITNTAVGGYKTSDVLKQLNEYESQGGNFAPNTTVVLDIGGNDLATGVDKNTVRNNINEIVSRLGEYGVNVILSGAPSMSSYEEAISSTNLAMDDLYHDVARNNPNVKVVDAMSGLLNQKGLMDESGFHLRDDDSKLQFLNQLAGAYTGGDSQGTVYIPQEIAQITQASQPQEQYTPAVESEPERSAGYNAAMQGDGLETYYQNISNYLAEPRTQEEIQDAMQFYSVSQADIDAAQSGGYASGGPAFKKLAFMSDGGSPPKGGKSARVKAVKGMVEFGKNLFADAPQAQALKLAQERAALPKSQNGLGLPKNNTPQQRAKAMNRDTDAYHGSKQDITGAFQPGYDDNLAFVTKSPEFANKWIGKGKHTQRIGEQAKQEVKSAEDMYRDIKSRNVNYDDELERLKGDEFNAEYDRRSALARAEAQKEFGTRGTPDQIHATVYPLTVQSKKIFNPETDMDVMAEFFKKNDIPPKLQELYAGGNYMMYETKPVVEYLKSKGYDSMRLRESTGDDYPTIAVFNPESVRSKFAAHDPFRKDAATAIAMGVAAPDLLANEQEKAEGGGAFKTIPWNKFQRFDGGGLAVDLSAPSEGASSGPLVTKKDVERLYENVKRNAPKDIANAAQKAKQHLKDEASQLGTLGGVKDFGLRVGASTLGGIPDTINLGLYLTDLAAGTNLSSENPWFGSQQYLDAMEKAGMLGENEFPISETLAQFVTPAGLVKKGVKKVAQIYKGAKKEPEKKRRGGLAAMSR